MELKALEKKISSTTTLKNFLAAEEHWPLVKLSWVTTIQGLYMRILESNVS
jgi:glutathionylspermidine synthase